MFRKIWKWVLMGMAAPLARAIYRRYRPNVIAITGSVGKTTTKEAVYQVLKPYFDVAKTPGSQNTEWGALITLIYPGYQAYFYNSKGQAVMSVPKLLLAILRGFGSLFVTLKYPKNLVLELGVDKPGDMEFFNSLMKYDIAVVTKVGESHMEFFKTYDKLFAEKTNIFNGLKETGLAIVGSEKTDLRDYARKLVVRHMSVGTESGDEIRVVRSERQKNAPNYFEIFADGEKFEFNNLLFGRHLDLVFGIAVAIGLEYSLTVSQITEALSLMKFSDRRFDVTKLSNGAFLVDDSYNASFDSMKLAIEGLEDVANGKKVLVLGDMKELGEQSTDSHLRVGKVAATADYLFTVGELGRVITEGAIKAGMKKENVTSLPDLKNMDEVNSLADAIIKKISNNDVVLVKASRSTALDRVANSIKTKIG